MDDSIKLLRTKLEAFDTTIINYENIILFLQKIAMCFNTQISSSSKNVWKVDNERLKFYFRGEIYFLKDVIFITIVSLF